MNYEIWLSFLDLLLSTISMDILDTPPPGKPVKHDCQEYLNVEHKLISHLGTTLLAELAVTNISNIDIIRKFRSRTKGILKIDCWVDVEELGPENNLESLYRRGFVFPANQSGMNFTSGGVSVALEKSSKRRKFVLCSVGVGRSHVVSSPDEIDHHHHPVPPDCDSVFCGQIPTLNDTWDHEAALTYTMYDANQVLPLYLVHYVVEPTWNERVKKQSYEQTKEKMNGSVGDDAAGGGGGGGSKSMSPPVVPPAMKHAQEMRAHMSMLNQALVELDETKEPETEIYALTKDTLLSLQDEVQHKMSQIISAEFELRRQMCEVQNAVRFYKHQRKCCHSPREIQLLLKNPGSHLNELFQSYGT